MPTKLIKLPDGKDGWIRKAYDPRDYRVPQAELERINNFSKAGYGTLDELAEHDGGFSSYREIRRFERDGKPWALLRHAREWAVEVELTRGKVGGLRPLDPEEAWKLARELDAENPRVIGFEGEPPA